MKQLLLGQTILGIVLVGPVVPADAQIPTYNNRSNWFQLGRRAREAPVNAENGTATFSPGPRDESFEWQYDSESNRPAGGPNGRRFVNVTSDVRIGTWEFLGGAWTLGLQPNTTTTFTGQGIAGDASRAFMDVNASATLEFKNRSQAGNGPIQNSGTISFYDFSGASNARITNNASGTINFNGNSTAGAPDASIRNFGTINFNESSSAGNATITNNNIVNLTGGSAGNATIINGDGFNNIGTLSFKGGSAANATITNNAGSTVSFTLSSSAAGAKITNNAGTITFSGNTSAGDAQIVNNAPAGFGGFRALEFKDFATATNATIMNNAGADTLFSGQASGGNARLIANGGRFDFVGLESPGTTVGSIEGSGIFFLGSKVLTVGGNNLSTTVTGRIGDSCLPPADCTNLDPPAPVGGSLVKIGTGTLTLAGVNGYTGPTTVREGELIVNGSIRSSSSLTVESGAIVGGTGVIPRTVVRGGGELSPGNSIGTLTVDGNLTLAPSSLYFVEFAEASDRAQVLGSAALDGSVALDFLPRGTYLKQYSILHADGGFAGTAFANVVAPPNFIATLSYGSNDVFLDLTPALGLGSALSSNASNVANAINGSFLNSGMLPLGLVVLYDVTGANLANSLSLLSGEAATGGQQAAFQMTNQFLGLMLDPFVDGRSGVAGAGGPALGFAPDREALPEEIALAYSSVLKAPPVKAPSFEQRWSVWGGAYGGSNRTSGDPAVVGSHDLAARAAGFAAGIDYHLAPDMLVGIALAGGGTNWSLASGLGGGKSDAFQAGVYGATRSGPFYLAAALSYTNHWMSTDRFALAGDHLTASFNAQSYGARVESGYRFPTMFGGLTPYAAIQAQNFRTPFYSETDLNGGGFALAYNSRTGTDTRSELGARFDRLLTVNSKAVLTLRARLAWAHDWVSDPTLAAALQALPGASFVVNGATPAKDSALASVGTELRLANGVSLIGKFDGEFAGHSSTYAGTGTARYTW